MKLNQMRSFRKSSKETLAETSFEVETPSSPKQNLKIKLSNIGSSFRKSSKEKLIDTSFQVDNPLFLWNAGLDDYSDNEDELSEPGKEVSGSSRNLLFRAASAPRIIARRLLRSMIPDATSHPLELHSLEIERFAHAAAPAARLSWLRKTTNDFSSDNPIFGFIQKDETPAQSVSAKKMTLEQVLEHPVYGPMFRCYTARCHAEEGVSQVNTVQIRFESYSLNGFGG
jgi:hypothetical protein